MQKSKLQFKIEKCLLIIALLFVAVPVFAAEIRVDGKNGEIKTGEQFTATIFLNTEESINAIEGKMVFPADLLELKEIRNGNSIINFWVDNPRMATNKDTNSNEIAFSGIIPGGYAGNNGLIFSLIFEVKKEGEGIIEIQNAKTLLHDGLGTPTQTTIKKLEFVSIPNGIPDNSRSVPKDAEPPEAFRPEIARDESLLGGKWFLAFATQDKSSGVDHYEIRESRQRFFAIFQRWSRGESPHVLEDQALRSYVFVKAVDNAGNSRVIKIAPRNPLPWYEYYENWLIIIAGFVIAYAIKKFYGK